MTGDNDSADRAGCNELRDEILSLCGRAAERLDLPIEWHLQALCEAMANIIVVKAEAENVGFLPRSRGRCAHRQERRRGIVPIVIKKAVIAETEERCDE